MLTILSYHLIMLNPKILILFKTFNWVSTFMCGNEKDNKCVCKHTLVCTLLGNITLEKVFVYNNYFLTKIKLMRKV